MKQLVLLILISCSFSSCKNTPEYWEISKFNLVKGALIDGEEIRLVYTSRSPDSNKDLEYYVHFVVVSVQSGDTVNVLSPKSIAIEGVSADDVFNYFDQINIASKLLQGDFNDLKSIDDVQELTKATAKKINKVVRDPKFDNIADNTHPTVIGSIGKLTLNESTSTPSE